MKCVLCEKEIDWEHHLFPLPYLMYDLTLIERFCPNCWNRIWAEWYEYPDSSDYYDLTYAYPTNEYIISKYKGNALVAKIERGTIVEELKRIFPRGAWSTNILGDKKPKLPKTPPLKTIDMALVEGKKKHWWRN